MVRPYGEWDERGERSAGWSGEERHGGRGHGEERRPLPRGAEDTWRPRGRWASDEERSGHEERYGHEERDERYGRPRGHALGVSSGDLSHRDPRRREMVEEGGDRGWPGGVRGSEGGAGYGSGFFGTAYGLYAGRPEHEPRGEDWRGRRDWRDEGRRPQGRQPKGYKRSDQRILDDIVERIVATGYDAGEIEVKVENGEVTLTGAVASRGYKRQVEDICEDVFGVHDVHNHLKVERDLNTTRPDTGHGGVH